MIRKLNAVAVAALALVAAAGAQAQSSVSVYGTIDEAIVSFKDAANSTYSAAGARIRGIEDGGMTSSFLGFAGTEDLGSGLKAKFKLETYVKADEGKTGGNGGFWGRNSWLGLSGGFGTVLAGQTETPLWNTTLAFNPFGSSLFSPAQRQYFGGYGHVAAVGQNNAWANSVTYYTPSELGGFSGALQYAFKEANNNGSAGSVGLSGGYAAGPLAVAVVYQQVKTGATYTNAHQNTWQLDGSYDLGVAKLFAQYGQVKDTQPSTLVAGPFKDKIWQLGASLPLGPGAALVSYGEQKSNMEDGSGDKASNKTFALGYDYVLSKRTDVYAAYAYDRASTNLGTKFDNTNSVGVGIRHRF